MDASSIVEDIIRREGVHYSNRPADHGGPTKFGITQRALARYLGHPVTVEAVQYLTIDKARLIYKKLYVQEPGFYKINNGPLAALLVDSGVQHGPADAIRWLQAAVGAVADGVLGPHTLAALAAKTPPAAYRGVLAQRITYYGQLIHDDHSQAVFALGWMRRVAEFATVDPDS